MTIVIAGATRQSLNRGSIGLDLYGLLGALDAQGAKILMSGLAHDIWMALLKSGLLSEQVSVVNYKVKERARLVTSSVIESFGNKSIVATDSLGI